LFINNSVSAEDAPVTFLAGSWPLYAQGGISVEPYPLVASCLTEFCAEVINTDGSSAHTVSIKFYEKYNVNTPPFKTGMKGHPLKGILLFF